MKFQLLSKGSTNAKTGKNEIETFILYLAPYNLSGKNICGNASPGCIASCLFSAGRGAFSNVYNARLRKTQLMNESPAGFYTQLGNELLYIQSKFKQVAIRLNGTSDLDHMELLKRYTGIDFLTYSNLIFYDYTKNINYIKKYLNTNYHYTFSQSECNNEKVNEALKLGVNVAVVFNELPGIYKGRKVINGDISDYRVNDPIGVIVGLKAKGKAKKDATGFVVRLTNNQ